MRYKSSTEERSKCHLKNIMRLTNGLPITNLLINLLYILVLIPDMTQ